MVHSCCIAGCGNSPRKDRRLSFYRFPKDAKLHQLWCEAISRNNDQHKKAKASSSWKPKPHARVCGKHFMNGRRGKSDVPQFYLEKTSKPFCDEKIYRSNEIPVAGFQMIKDDDLKIKSSNRNRAAPMGGVLERLLQIVKTSPEESEHSYCIQLPHKINQLQQAVDDMHIIIEDLRDRLRKSENENAKKTRKINELREEKRGLEKELVRSKFHYNMRQNWRVDKMNAKQLNYYVGFKDHDVYNNFRDFILPAYTEAMSLIVAKQQSPNEVFVSNAPFPPNETNKILKFDQELTLVLMKMRLGLREQDLAYRFDVSQSTVRRVWKFWISLLVSQQIQELVHEVPYWLRTAVAEYSTEMGKNNCKIQEEPIE